VVSIHQVYPPEHITNLFFFLIYFAGCAETASVECRKCLSRSQKSSFPLRRCLSPHPSQLLPLLPFYHCNYYRGSNVNMVIRDIGHIKLQSNPRRCQRHSAEFKHKLRIEEQLTERYFSCEGHVTNICNKNVVIENKLYL
jgi:hypothetical protein